MLRQDSPPCRRLPAPRVSLSSRDAAGEKGQTELYQRSVCLAIGTARAGILIRRAFNGQTLPAVQRIALLLQYSFFEVDCGASE